MTTCDWCKVEFKLSGLFNVDYLDENGNDNGYANVLCASCVEEIDEPAEVWQSATI